MKNSVQFKAINLSYNGANQNLQLFMVMLAGKYLFLVKDEIAGQEPWCNGQNATIGHKAWINKNAGQKF